MNVNTIPAAEEAPTVHSRYIAKMTTIKFLMIVGREGITVLKIDIINIKKLDINIKEDNT